MTEKAVEVKAETLPDLDDLLQCPVCYEIPSGQIFQCNEGHHVCGRCKLRLDVCPVCRAFFFGTRNYAMEELIANIRKLRAFKLGGKVTTGNTTPEQQSVEAKESTSEESESINNAEDDDVSSRTSVEPPRPCSGLFRCLCCKTNPERLPSARLLNHLRYFHSPELIEGRSENGEYLQAWQFSTDVGRIVTAVRVADMGLFFLVIEITHDSVYAWLVMASSPRVAEEFSYTFTLSGNDREAIFTDCVWSVRTCEGFLKKRERCLSISGADARALLAPRAMSARLALRRSPPDAQPQPRAVLRVANRSRRDDTSDAVSPTDDLEPFLQDLQNDVARLSRAFANLGREANALVRSEAQMRARLDYRRSAPAPAPVSASAPIPAPQEASEAALPERAAPLSRNARRRMRQRLRQAFREAQTADSADDDAPIPTANNIRVEHDRPNQVNSGAPGGARNNHGDRADAGVLSQTRAPVGRAEESQPSPVSPPPPPPPPTTSNGDTTAPPTRRNKKKRRQRK